MTVARLLRPLCFAVVAMAGCVVSPQPSPPEVDLDGARIDLRPGVELTGNVIGFRAAPGSVDPAKGQVVITNLDTSDAPSFADVQSDGSFEIAVPGESGQTFRFQAKDGDARSDPFNLEVSASGGSVSPLALAPTCLTIDPARWVALDGAGAKREVSIQNGCAGAVSLASPRLRRGLAGFSAFPAAPITLAAGAGATITVRAGAGAEVEDVLLLDVTAPGPARRALTLTVPDR